MYLNAGCEIEYRARHDAIWPELVALLGAVGISNYSIFFDSEANILFAYLERRSDHSMG
jgi:L-rhamnose mutarotase